MDWVHCNQCFYRPGQQPKKELILTSCGHIFCKCCERSAQIEHCKVCGLSCSTTSLSSQMPDNVRVYFEDPESALERTMKVIEFQKSHRVRLSEYLKVLWEKYQKIKFAYQEVVEENRKLKKENEMYRKGLMTPPSPSHKTPLFGRNCQESPFIRMQSQDNRRLSSPFFITPTRPASSSQNYRHQNTPSTPVSDGSNSPGSVTSQQSYRSAASRRTNSQQKMYRPGLTPPLNHLSLLSVSTERARDSSSRY